MKSSLISAGCAVQGIGLHYLLITASTEDYCKIVVLTAREGVTKPDWIDRSNWEESVESQFFIWLRPRSLSFIHEEREKTTISHCPQYAFLREILSAEGMNNAAYCTDNLSSAILSLGSGSWNPSLHGDESQVILLYLFNPSLLIITELNNAWYLEADLWRKDDFHLEEGSETIVGWNPVLW